MAEWVRWLIFFVVAGSLWVIGSLGLTVYEIRGRRRTGKW
jgi:hypothetical protein